MKTAVVVSAFVGLSPTDVSGQEFYPHRTWKSACGSFSVEANFIEMLDKDTLNLFSNAKTIRRKSKCN